MWNFILCCSKYRLRYPIVFALGRFKIRYNNYAHSVKYLKNNALNNFKQNNSRDKIEYIDDENKVSKTVVSDARRVSISTRQCLVLLS